MAAIVVAHRPGDWFTDTLESLALQDYDALSTVIVDAAASGMDEQIAAVLPDAEIIDAPGSSGFSEAANAVLVAGLQADYLLLCHDDVALAPDAVQVLVQEAMRSKAGVVGPKIVDWERPDIIRHAGYDVDRFGVNAERVGVDELDQEQHDRVADVFALPSAVMLIRRDLFMRLEGFDPAITFRGESVDLCWRAQMAGSRVMFVPGAVARHRSRLVERTGVDDVRRTETRHALRAMLVNHGRISLTLMLPAAALMALCEIVVALLTARIGRARDVASAWLWNISRLDGVGPRRRANKQVRVVRQADVTALQYFGSIRVVSFFRRHFGGDSDGLLGTTGRRLLQRRSTGRSAWIAWILGLVVVVFGSRNLLTQGVAAAGDFASFGANAGDLFDAWWGGWSERSGGAPSANLPILVHLAAAGWLLGNSMELLRTLTVIAALVAGLAGAYRLLAPTGSQRAQAATLIAYLLVPLAPASVASGSLAGLVGYAAAPWMLRALLTASRTAPFGAARRPPATLWSSAVGLGAAAGAAALVVPTAAGLMLILAAGLAAGSLLAGRPAAVPRLLAAVVLAVPAAAFVSLSTVVDLAASGPSWDVAADGRDGTAGDFSFAELLRFAVGPDDPGLLVWLFAVPMVVPLLLGRGWRLEQSVRLWLVACVAWAVALAAQRGTLGFGLPDPHLLLAPAAIAVAGLCGLAVVSIEHDLRFSHFGWRQALVPATALAVLVVAAGSVGSLEDGRWGLVSSGHDSSVRFEAPVLSGAYRVLWIGAPEFLAVQGRPLDPGVAWAATSGDTVTVADRAIPFDDGAAETFEQAISEITGGRTSRGGRILAGVGVRYVVLLHRQAPAPFAAENQARPVPEHIAEALRDQLDLQRVEGTNSAVDVFVNTAWVPMRALHPPGFDDGVTEIADLQARPLIAGAALFSGDGDGWTAPVPGDSEILTAHTPRPGWSLTVDGAEVPRREALSWTRAFVLDDPGQAELSYSPPWWRRAAQVIGTAAPVVLMLGWLRRRLGET